MKSMYDQTTSEENYDEKFSDIYHEISRKLIGYERRGYSIAEANSFIRRYIEQYMETLSDRITDEHEDMDMLRAYIPELKYISPVIFQWKEDNNVVRGDKYGAYYVKGLNPEYNFIEPQSMLYGRYLNEIDIRDRRKVCVIGKRVYEEMFTKGENPLGHLLKVGGIYYRVIGVNEPITQVNIGGDPKESIILPFTVMQQTYNRGGELDCIAVTAVEDVRIGKLEEKISGLLKARHSISPTDPMAIQSMNVEKQFRMFKMLFLGISILIWIVGLGTLLAGVVGVSNIMMVTVKERTREIGVRRALGAKPWNIISQIMSESLLLTALAGLLGLSAGVFLLDLVDKIMSAQPASNGTMMEHPEVSIQIAVAATVILLFSGLLAGLIPAWRAMQIKAIDAIREE